MPDLPAPTPVERLLARPPESLAVYADLDGVQARLPTLGVSGLRLLWVDQLPWLLPLAAVPVLLGMGVGLAAPAAITSVALALGTVYLAGLMAAGWLARSRRVRVSVDQRALRLGRWSRPLRDIRHVLVAHGFFGQPFLYVVTEGGEVWMWSAEKSMVSTADVQWLADLVRGQAARAGHPLEPVPEGLRALLEKRAP